MKVLLDTNIFLDVGFKRPGFFESSKQAIRRSQGVSIHAFIAWHSISNIYYIVSSQQRRQKARDFIEDILQWTDVAPVKTSAAVAALRYPMKDFEDALQASAAMACGADYLITRNVKDYHGAPLPVITPEKFALV